MSFSLKNDAQRCKHTLGSIKTFVLMLITIKYCLLQIYQKSEIQNIRFQINDLRLLDVNLHRQSIVRQSKNRNNKMMI